VMLLNSDGFPVAQKDSPPFNGERPTSTWAAGQVIYDPKYLEPMNGMSSIPPGDYTVIVKVYLWSPEDIVDIATVEGNPWVIVGALHIE